MAGQNVSVLNVIDLQIIDPIKQSIVNQVHQWLDQNYFQRTHIYIEKKNNPFLEIALSMYNYKMIYNNGFKTEIIVPAIQENSVYTIEDDSEFEQCDSVIMYKQIGNSNKNDIQISTDTINNRPAIIITFETKSDYGVYDTYSMDMYPELF